MLDLDERVGSLEPGKDADFVVLSGDPLSVYTHVLETWVEGAEGLRPQRSRRTGCTPTAATARATTQSAASLASTATSEEAPMTADGIASLPSCAARAPRGARAPGSRCAARPSTPWPAPPIKDGVVLVEGRQDRGRRAGRRSRRSPRATVLLAAKVVTPGLVDAHSTVGLSGFLNQPHDQDQLETSAADPARAARDRRLQRAASRSSSWVRGFGVTTIHTGHGPGALDLAARP